MEQSNKIKQQFLYYKTLRLFLEDYNADKILDSSIAFVEKPGFVWTHGHTYAYYETNASIEDESRLIVKDKNDAVIFAITFSNDSIILRAGDKTATIPFAHNQNTTIEQADLSFLETKIRALEEAVNLNKNDISANTTDIQIILSRLNEIDGKYVTVGTLDHWTNIFNTFANYVDNQINSLINYKTTIRNYVDTQDLELNNRINLKLNILTAVAPLKIQDDVISIEADTNIYVLIAADLELPIVGNPNKIYLKETRVGNISSYTQHKYDVDRGWISLGSVVPTVDLTSYVKRNELDLYATKQDVNVVQNQVDSLNATVVDLGNQVLQISSDLSDHLRNLPNILTIDLIKDELDGYYVKWSEVHTIEAAGSRPVVVDPDTPDTPSNPTTPDNPDTPSDPTVTPGSTVINNIYNIDVDDRLKVDSENPVLNKAIYAKFSQVDGRIDAVDSRVTEINNTYRSEVNTINQSISQTNTDIERLTLDILALRNSIQTVDLTQVWSSINSLTTGIATVDARVTSIESDIQTINNTLANKQDRLIAGDGISINNNIISSTIDTQAFIIVTELPHPGNPNKIYLLETVVNGLYVYSEYHWDDTTDDYVYIGERSPLVDLSGYLRESDKTDILNYVSNNYDIKGSADAVNTSLELYKAQVTNILNDYQLKPDGDTFALTSIVNNMLTELSNQITALTKKFKDYVNWLEVWHEDIPGSRPIDIEDPDNPSTPDTPGEPDTPSEQQQPTQPDNNNYKATNLVTLTVGEYQALVDAGTVQEDVYYFTYEGESSTWGFGDKFPVVLSGDWTFGGTFPVTLSGGEWEFPINLT